MGLTSRKDRHLGEISTLSRIQEYSFLHLKALAIAPSRVVADAELLCLRCEHGNHKWDLS